MNLARERINHLPTTSYFLQARKLLPKPYHLRLKLDFQKVFKKGKSVFSDFLVLKFGRNDLERNRFGFIIGLKVSKKAVVRNLIKRRMRAIVKENLKAIKPGFDIVFITRPQIVGKKYQEIKNEMEKMLRKAELL